MAGRSGCPMAPSRRSPTPSRVKARLESRHPKLTPNSARRSRPSPCASAASASTAGRSEATPLNRRRASGTSSATPRRAISARSRPGCPLAGRRAPPSGVSIRTAPMPARASARPAGTLPVEPLGDPVEQRHDRRVGPAVDGRDHDGAERRERPVEVLVAGVDVLAAEHVARRPAPPPARARWDSTTWSGDGRGLARADTATAGETRSQRAPGAPVRTVRAVSPSFPHAPLHASAGGRRPRGGVPRDGAGGDALTEASLRDRGRWAPWCWALLSSASPLLPFPTSHHASGVSAV